MNCWRHEISIALRERKRQEPTPLVLLSHRKRGHGSLDQRALMKQRAGRSRQQKAPCLGPFVGSETSRASARQTQTSQSQRDQSQAAWLRYGASVGKCESVRKHDICAFIDPVRLTSHWTRSVQAELGISADRRNWHVQTQQLVVFHQPLHRVVVKRVPRFKVAHHHFDGFRRRPCATAVPAQGTERTSAGGVRRPARCWALGRCLVRRRS